MEHSNTKRTDILFDNASYHELNVCSENYTVAPRGHQITTCPATPPQPRRVRLAWLVVVVGYVVAVIGAIATWR